MKTMNDQTSIDRVRAGLAKRYAAERRFRMLGMGAILISLALLAMLFTSIVSKGAGGFERTEILVPIYYDDARLDRDNLGKANYKSLITTGMQSLFPTVTKRRDKRELSGLVSNGGAYILQKRVMANPDLIGATEELWLPADDDVDVLVKGHIDRNLPEADRRIKDKQLRWIEKLEQDGRVETRFNPGFFTSGDSRDAEMAGIGGALAGSMLTLAITLLLSFPIGVLAAVYLEEFAPQNRWTDLIEINVNNLAAVPSIVFGLLGLAVFISFFGMPRSAPLVGGLVLTLMTLPTIIISSRAALKSVPPSIRQAALGIGASRIQMVFHHVVPLALPGMLTGTIIGMAQALGESAPLLMIGMVAFIVDVPGGFMDPSTVLPVQVYLWADSPERAFVEKTSAAILVLLGFLVLMNAIAVILRKRFERRW
jgi:phosphate transport system permease protein